MNAPYFASQKPGRIARRAVPERRQRGVVLVVAMVVLVAMMLASVAMVRSIDTATVIAGNLAFKQSATAGADAGIEAAVAWLTSHTGSLTADSATEGYYATSQKCLDLTGTGKLDASCMPPFTALDWTDASKVKTLPAADAAGNTVSYVIHRMCSKAGPLDGASCAVEQSTQGGNSMGIGRQMGTYQEGSWTAVANRGYYRITARAAGPRNTAGYVQAIVSM